MTPVATRLFETSPDLEDMSEEQREFFKQKLNQILYRE